MSKTDWIPLTEVRDLKISRAVNDRWMFISNRDPRKKKKKKKKKKKILKVSKEPNINQQLFEIYTKLDNFNRLD